MTVFGRWSMPYIGSLSSTDRTFVFAELSNQCFFLCLLKKKTHKKKHYARQRDSRNLCPIIIVLNILSCSLCIIAFAYSERWILSIIGRSTIRMATTIQFFCWYRVEFFFNEEFWIRFNLIFKRKMMKNNSYKSSLKTRSTSFRLSSILKKK